METFLTLPQELRNSIIEYVVLHEKQPPKNPETAQDSRIKPPALLPKDFNVSTFKGFVSHNYGPSHVLYEKKDSFVASSTALLCCSKSLNLQTKKVLDSLFSSSSSEKEDYDDDHHGMIYKLDVMVVNETELWPTWLKVPALSHKIKRIDVNFRVFGFNKEASHHDTNAFEGGCCSGPMKIVWTFFFLLEHFVKSGPVPFNSNDHTTDDNNIITVQQLNLDFQAGDESNTLAGIDDSKRFQAQWQALQSSHSHGRRRQTTQDPTILIRPFAIHEKWLAEMVFGDIYSIVNMSYHTALYGMLLYDHIGSITVTCKDSDNFKKELDLDAYLKPMTAHNTNDERSCYTTKTFGWIDGNCRVMTFWNWKWGVLNKRIEDGISHTSIEDDDVLWPTLQNVKGWKENKHCQNRGCLCSENGLQDWLKNKSES